MNAFLRNAAAVMCLLLAGHIFVSEAAAQQRKAAGGKASISGTVSDTKGTVVPGASVELTGSGNFKEEKLSDENGNYSFTGLRAGIYSLKVSAPGLPELKLENITIGGIEQLPLDAMMQGELPASKRKTEAAVSPQVPAPPAGQAVQSLPVQVPVMPQLASPPPSATNLQGTGIISGVATDSTGAVLPGATVVLVERDGFVRETTTDDSGSYFFAGLKPGKYTVSVNAKNFAEQKFENISVSANEKVPLDVSLQPEKSNEQVNVVGNSVGQVEADTATVSGTITEKEVVKIGLNGRNFTQLIALAPGVSNQTGQDEAKVGVQGSVKYSVNGGRVEYNTFEVDGSDVLNTGLNGASSTLMVYPSLDAIQEVKVLTSNYGAQYGRTASGTVQVTTKSGGNALHGNLYDFVRNEAFNARNYFDIAPQPLPERSQNFNGTPVIRHIHGKAPLYRRQDFGGTVGGPLSIPHVYTPTNKKTFFFFSEEMRLEKTPTEFNQAVPGLKERGLVLTPQGVQRNLVTAPSGIAYQDFDFSDVCPLQSPGSNPPLNRQLFPDCPALPATVLSPLYHLNQPSTQPGSGAGVDKNALEILNANLIPLPNSPTGCNFTIPNGNPLDPNSVIDPTDPNHCYVASVSPSTYWRQELFRVDQTVTEKMKLSFRYIHDAWDTTVLSPQWSLLRTTNPSAATFPTIQNRFVGPGTSMVLHGTNVFSPTLLNDAVISYSNSAITLVDQNGPGGAVFQRNPSLDQPLVSDSSAPGQCNPSLSVDPVSGLPQCAIGHIFNNGFAGKVPGVEFLGTNAAYGGRGFAVDPAYMPWGHTNPTYSFRDDVVKSHGGHTLQFGAQFVYSQRNQTNNAIGAASGELQGFLTFSNLVHSTGNAFADFLLQNQFQGQPVQSFIQSFSQDSAQGRYYQRYQIAEPYFQDDWKVTPRLTLNLGLRVSLFGTYHENRHDAWNWEAARFNASRFAVDPFSGVLLDKAAGSPAPPVMVNPSTLQLDPSVISDLGLVQCGSGGVPAGCMKSHLFNPAPRIGFAWDPKGDGKASIRGGYGIFFEHGTGNEANTGSLEASAPLVLSMSQPLPLNYYCIGNIGFGPSFDPSNSGCTLDSTHPAPPAGAAYPLNVTAIPTKAVWPYAQQWSFGVQRETRGHFVVNMAYVGSRGTHLTLERNVNQMVPLPLNQNPFGPTEPLTISDCTVSPITGGGIPGDGSTPFLLQSGVIITPQSPAYIHMQAACASPSTPNVNSLPHPYPGLGQVLSLENVASSSYHAVQFTARRTSGPLTFGLSYSYSHSIDNSSDRSDPVLVNSYDLAENKASSNFDQRHLLTLSYIYSLNSLTRWLQNINDADFDPADGTPQAKVAGDPPKLLKALASNWQVSGVTLFASGTPFTVINSAGNTGISLTDNAGVASGFGIASSFPDVARGLSRAYNNALSVGPLIGDPSQFVAPRGLTFGDAGRNYLNNPSRLNFDIALARHFKVIESGDLEFRAEVFNVFNHTQFRIYDPDNPGGTGNNVISCYAGPANSAGFHAAGGADCVTGASFLHPLNAHRSRTMQFGLKWGF